MKEPLNGYKSVYHEIQDKNPPSVVALFPNDNKCYKIDLNTRQVEAPEFLSVETDHDAEVIYFMVNRYYDFYDLAESICVITYENALGEFRVYPVPYLDVSTNEQLIIFPWMISNDVAKAAGEVKYSFTFYRLSDFEEGKYLYKLNTLPATSKVLKGIGPSEEVEGQVETEEEYYASLRDDFLSRLVNAEGKDIFWEES